MVSTKCANAFYRSIGFLEATSDGRERRQLRLARRDRLLTRPTIKRSTIADSSLLKNSGDSGRRNAPATSRGQAPLNRDNRFCGAWLAIESDCVANCCLVCNEVSWALSAARSASVSAPTPAVRAELRAVVKF